MILDIVLLPPKDLSEKIGKFVSKLSKQFKLKMAVDNKKLLPHISLFHIKTSSKRVPGITKAVAMISGGFPGQNLRFTAPRTGRDYFVMDLAKTKILKALHQQVVFQIHNHRIGVGIGNHQDNKQGAVYVKKYGAGNVLKNFQPHITLGIVKSPRDLNGIKPILLKLRFRGFKSNRLALTRVNGRRQVYKIIKEFKLHG